MNLPFVSLAVSALAFLPWTASAQGTDPTKEKPKRTLRLLVAGVRPMPAFEQRGDKVEEVEPPLESIPPTSLEIMGGEQAATGDKAQPNKFSAWPNEMVTVPGYKGSAQIRLRLLRPLVAKPATPPEVTCDLAEMISPLILLSADPGHKGWEKPIATVVDLSAEKLPARSVMFINLSTIPLGARFDEAAALVKASETKYLRMSANGSTDVRFRVDAMSGEESFPIVNSSYQVPANSRLLVLAMPNPKGAQGVAPVTLKMIVDPVALPVSAPATR